MGDAGPYSIGSSHWPGISKLIEEAGEVIQVAGKLLGSGGVVEHWDGTNLKTRLEDEIGDVLAATDFVVRHCGLDPVAVEARRLVKRTLFEKWHREQGK